MGGMGEETKKGEPLTLEGLAKYTQETLLPAIDKRFEKVDERFEGLDRRFDTMDKRLNTLGDKVLEHDKKFDEHDKRFDNLEEFGRRILTLQDQTLTILRKKEIEQTATTSWLKRLDKDVEQLKKKAGLKTA